MSVARDAMKAVIVVPMFAPSMSGKAFSRESTPEEQSGTSKEVVMLEDWTEMVIAAPARIASSPDRRTAAFSACSAFPAITLRM